MSLTEASLCKHPQDCVLPLSNASPRTGFVSPHSHLTFQHRCPLIFPANSMTVRRPNDCPVRSVRFSAGITTPASHSQHPLQPEHRELRNTGASNYSRVFPSRLTCEGAKTVWLEA